MLLKLVLSKGHLSFVRSVVYHSGEDSVNSRESGAVFVEFALGVTLFFLVIFSGIDLIRVGLTWVSLQSAANVGARQATMARPSAINALDEIRNVVKKRSIVNLDVVDDIYICPINLSSCTGAHAGWPGARLKVEVRPLVKLFFGAVQFRLKARAYARIRAI